MADIFISYSSKDREQAERLTEHLSSAGHSVWIDRHGIGAAASWSEEIVRALDVCKAFVVLLSPFSIQSKNVVREVALAFEKNKKIVPLDLEPVQLPASLQYHLAGLQRTPVTSIDAIIEAIGDLSLAAPEILLPKAVKEKDTRKSIMVLPFEDLSPVAENGWFADGIVNDLIAGLSHIKILRVADQQSTKDYKRYEGTLSQYATGMSIRYFVQGDVRKVGDQIKVSASLLDIETGDHLWQDSMKGAMSDIFDIQENMAKKVVEGLKIHLSAEESKNLCDCGTDNPEVYELYLKGDEYFQRQTKEGFELAVQLFSEAILLDPKYVRAYVGKAHAIAGLYRSYTRDTKLLDEGLSLLSEALRQSPDTWSASAPLSAILMLHGKLDEAERVAQDYVLHAPEEYSSHFALGFFYMSTGQDSKAIAPFEESLRLHPDYLITFWNLVLACNNVGDEIKQKHYAEMAIPKFVRHLRLFPDDENKRVNHAVLLHFAGRDTEAKAAARTLDSLKDGSVLYNVACLQCVLQDYELGVITFYKAITSGFRDLRDLKAFLESKDRGIGTLKGTPLWEEARLLVENMEAETKRTNG